MCAKKIIVALGLALALSACASGEPASRAMGVESLTLASQGGPSGPGFDLARPAFAAAYSVQDVQVIVPRSLVVSEANTFKPRADIVWHGDPAGDRYTQVGNLVLAAARQATAPMVNGSPVTVELTLTRFHALTEKTRRSFGGMHEMRFDLVVRDVSTGAVLDGPRMIVADTKAAGGARAIAEEAAGRSQKVVVTERLVEVLRRELSSPQADMPLVARADLLARGPVVVTR